MICAGALLLLLLKVKICCRPAQGIAQAGSAGAKRQRAECCRLVQGNRRRRGRRGGDRDHRAIGAGTPSVHLLASLQLPLTDADQKVADEEMDRLAELSLKPSCSAKGSPAALTDWPMPVIVNEETPLPAKDKEPDADTFPRSAPLAKTVNCPGKPEGNVMAVIRPPSVTAYVADGPSAGSTHSPGI